MPLAAPQPRLVGPIIGGEQGWPFGSPSVPAASYGYVEEEFFLEGEAASYRPEAGVLFGRDGRWAAAPATTAPYRTRVVVYRPSHPARFNGTVVVGWSNVSSGYDLLSTAEIEQLFRDGAGIAQVTTQFVGIEGFPSNPRGLKQWDPERYRDLLIPNDDFSFDIFGQAATAVGPRRKHDGPDPMGGLDVERLVAHGGSQSGQYLATYANAIQPLSGVFDGFFFTLWFAHGIRLDNGERIYDPVGMTAEGRESLSYPMGEVSLRRDLGVPVFVVNSESESLRVLPARQPDTPRFRFWEVAGAAHATRQLTQSRLVKFERDGVPSGVPLDGINELPMGPVYNAAFRRMQAWLARGDLPPSHPPIEVSGSPPEIRRDRYGNAIGGVRLPQLDVPLGRHSRTPWSDQVVDLLRGSTEPFSEAQAQELYGDQSTYLKRFEESARDAVRRGVLLEDDVPRLLEEAGDAWPSASTHP